MTDGPLILGLLALFGIAFGAATFIPFQSEIVFVALQMAERTPVWVLVVVASIGNTLGSFFNYGLGRGIERYRHKRWFPIKDRQLDRAQAWFSRFGVWALLLSWAPLGDALTMVAGVMRTPPGVFLLLVGFAKTVRYILVALLTHFVTG